MTSALELMEEDRRRSPQHREKMGQIRISNGRS